MTPSSIESMLQCAGFEVKERFVSPFSCIFVCRTAPTQFVAESGPWPVACDALDDLRGGTAAINDPPSKIDENRRASG
jgi:hypothetical protein